jgi:hypothetical protein
MTKHNILSRAGTTGSSRARASPSKLDVVKRTCKYCGHHKGLDSVFIRKCARCKKEV